MWCVWSREAAENSYDVAYRKYNGTSWDSRSTYLTTEVPADNNRYAKALLTQSAPEYVPVAWLVGTGSPRQLRFAKIVLAGALQDLQVSLGSTYTGSRTNAEVTATTSTTGALDSDDTITLLFPKGFDLSTVTAGDVTVRTTGNPAQVQTLAYDEIHNGLTLVNPLASIPASANFTVTLSNEKLRNHITPGNYTVRAFTSEDRHTVESQSFALTIGPATHFLIVLDGQRVVGGGPSPANPITLTGTPAAQVVGKTGGICYVYAVDDANNRDVTYDSDTLALAVREPDGGGSFTQSQPRMDNGVGTFTVTFSGDGTPYIRASDGALVGSSDRIAVTPPPTAVRNVVIAVVPSTAGVPSVHTIEFDATKALLAAEAIALEYPGGFNLEALTAADVSVQVGTGQPQSARAITLQTATRLTFQAGQPVDADAHVKLVLGSEGHQPVNAPVAQSYRVRVHTARDTDLAPSPSFDIVPDEVAGFDLVAPGQAFVQGKGVMGEATPQAIGQPIPYDIYAVDQHHNRVTGYNGTASLSYNDEKLVPVEPASVTLTNGFGEFTVSYKTAGTRTVTATAGPVTGSSTLSVSAGVLGKYLVEVAERQTLEVGFTAEVYAADADGNRIGTDSSTIDLSASPPDHFRFYSSSTYTQQITQTQLANGRAVLYCKDTADLPESVLIRVSKAGAPTIKGEATVNLLSSGKPTKLIVVMAGESVPGGANSPSNPVTHYGDPTPQYVDEEPAGYSYVYATDAQGNLATRDAVSVTLANTTDGGATFYGGAEGGTLQLANGKAAFKVRFSKPSGASGHTVTATETELGLKADTGRGVPVYSRVSGQPRMTLTPSPANIPADDNELTSSTITAQVLGGDGNPISGVTVSFIVTSENPDGVGRLERYSQATGSDGKATTTLYSKRVICRNTIRATATVTVGGTQYPLNAWTAVNFTIPSGNSLSYTDISIPGRGPALEFTRTYNSQDPYDGPLSPGWRHNYEMATLIETPGDFCNVTVVWNTGQPFFFEADWETDRYISPPGFTGTLHDLTWESGDIGNQYNHVYRLDMPDGTSYTFYQDGWAPSYVAPLRGITDRNNQDVNLEYNDDGLWRVSCPGRMLEFSYSGGKISQIVYTGPTSPPDNTRTYRYYYNNGRLERFLDPQRYEDAPSDWTWKYAYNEGGAVYDGAGREITSVYDAAHRRIQYSYSASGDHSMTQIADGEGNETTFAWDYANGTTRGTNALGQSSPVSYDAFGSPISQQDPAGATTSLEHEYYPDRTGVRQATVVINALGRVTQETYDEHGNVLTRTDAEGRTTSMEYGIWDLPTRVVDPLGHETSIDYTYTQSGVVTQQVTTDPLNRTVSATFDPNTGNKLTDVDAKGKTTTYTYGWGGNWLASVTGPIPGSTTTFAYNALGNQTKSTDANGHSNWSFYDLSGRLTKSYSADNPPVPEGQPTNTPSMQYAYYPDGKKLSETDFHGNTTYYYYDANGQMAKTYYPDNPPTPNVESPTNTPSVQYVYDAAGRKTQEIVLAGTLQDPQTRTTYFYYDAANRLCKTYYPDNPPDPVSDPQNPASEESVYNAVGSRVQSLQFTGAKGNNRQNVTEFIYDASNRLIEQRVRDANGVVIQQVQMGYGEVGRKAWEKDGEGHQTDCEYDDAGQLTRELYPAVEGVRHHKDYTYDANGNRETEANEEGDRTKWVYDDGGRLWKVFDPRYVQSGSKWTEYVYDLVGNKRKQIDLNGHTTWFYYDAMNRLVKTYYPDNPPNDEQAPTNVASVEEVYDQAGNRIAQKTKNGSQQDTTTYTYDARNRVETITYPGSQNADVAYTYDLAGNRLTMTDAQGTTSYEYDVRNRLATETKAQGWVLEYDYDLAGNKVEFQVTVNSTVKVVNYAYDEANRLRRVTDPDEGTSGYEYYVTGSRKRLTYPNGMVADYVYDERNRLTDLHNHKGTTTISRHRYTHYADGNRATLTDQDDRVTTYTYDPLNRLIEEKQVAAGGGTVYWHGFEYDDVGNLLKKRDLTTSPPTVLTELTYNAADQITSTGFGYDDRGNMLSEHRPEVGEDWTYEFDSQNRLTHAYDGTNNFSYEYDGDGHRVKQTVNQIVTEFVLDLNSALVKVMAMPRRSVVARL